MEVSIIVIATSISKIDIICNTASLKFRFTYKGFMIVFRFNYRRTIRPGISSLKKYLYLYTGTLNFVVILGLSL